MENWLDKEISFYDFIWQEGVQAHGSCINKELFRDFTKGGNKFEEMKKLILKNFPTKKIAEKEFNKFQKVKANDNLDLLTEGKIK